MLRYLFYDVRYEKICNVVFLKKIYNYINKKVAKISEILDVPYFFQTTPYPCPTLSYFAWPPQLPLKSDIIYERSIGQTVISVTGKNLGQGSNDLLLRITLGIILTLRFLILISSILLNIPRGIILCSAILLLHQLPHLFDALQCKSWSYISQVR